jgi:hypothetical protein
MWDVRVKQSQRAFTSELEAVAFGVTERFDVAGRMGLIPRNVTEVSFSYDLDVPTGIFRIFAGDRLIVAIETPDEQLSPVPISFNAKWMDSTYLEVDVTKPYLGYWYVTTPEEQDS